MKLGAQEEGEDQLLPTVIRCPVGTGDPAGDPADGAAGGDTRGRVPRSMVDM